MTPTVEEKTDEAPYKHGSILKRGTCLKSEGHDQIQIASANLGTYSGKEVEEASKDRSCQSMLKIQTLLFQITKQSSYFFKTVLKWGLHNEYHQQGIIQSLNFGVKLSPKKTKLIGITPQTYMPKWTEFWPF